MGSDAKNYAALSVIGTGLSVCRIVDPKDADLTKPFTFLSVTDGEYSLVCPSGSVPKQTIAREDGWRGFRIKGQLDFSLVGILSHLSGILAGGGIGIFAISTYDTDYILVKEEDLDRALALLEADGYRVVGTV